MEKFTKHSLLKPRSWLMLIAAFSCLVITLYAADFFELGPIQYSKSTPENAVTALAKKEFKSNQNTQKKLNDLSFLASVLKELDVSADSQTLVYSRTSLQKKRIFPSYPRALYFSDSTYVGYVPGGDVEVITHDPKLGLVFYMIKLEQKKQDDRDKADSKVRWGYHVTRRKDCLSCHVSSKTSEIPGLFMRSVTTDKNGEIDFKGERYYVDDKTPVKQRWGGWYVTGNWSGITHMGNAISGKSQLGKLANLQAEIKTSRYLRDTSDIGALMVLEHQCKVHTVMVEVKMRYQRAVHLAKALTHAEDPSVLVAKKRAAERAVEILVPELLFCKEAKIGGFGVQGNKEFEKAFTAKAIKSKSGKHLRKLRLYGRLFKYRCSYMIHSKAFKSLPEMIKKLTFQRIHKILSTKISPKGYEYLKAREKKAILDILSETTEMNKYLNL